MVGSPIITPRDGYPLYFADRPAVPLGRRRRAGARAEPGVGVDGGARLRPARARRRRAVGIDRRRRSARRCSSPASYTFWSQAVIAEVYALHIAAGRADAAAAPALGSSGRPRRGWRCSSPSTRSRFGNHLSMILLAPAYALFLLLAAPGGWRSLLTPRVVALAIALRAAPARCSTRGTCGAVARAAIAAGRTRSMRCGTFWFDVTKSDWRDTMVMNVPRSMVERPCGDVLVRPAAAVRRRLAPLLAVAGLAQLARDQTARRAVLMLALYATNVAVRVQLQRRRRARLLPAVAPDRRAARGAGDAWPLAVPERRLDRHGRRAAARPSRCSWPTRAARAYRDYPALDRSGDDRPARGPRAR